MLSLVRVGKEWNSLVFLHPDNCLHKVGALSCQGGERLVWPRFSPPPKKHRLYVYSCPGGKRMDQPSFSPPSKTKGCLHIHDKVRLILSLVRVGKEWAGTVFFHPNNEDSAQD